VLKNVKDTTIEIEERKAVIKKFVGDFEELDEGGEDSDNMNKIRCSRSKYFQILDPSAGEVRATIRTPGGTKTKG